MWHWAYLVAKVAEGNTGRTLVLSLPPPFLTCHAFLQVPFAERMPQASSTWKAIKLGAQSTSLKALCACGSDVRR